MARQTSKGRGAAVSLGILPDLIGFHIRMAYIADTRGFLATVGDLDIAPGRMGMLAVLEANPGISQNQLAQAIRLDRSTLVPVLDGMEVRGLVERRPHPDDRRTNALWLTEGGAALLRKLKKLVAKHEDQLMGALSAEERAELFRLLKKLSSPPEPE